MNVRVVIISLMLLCVIAAPVLAAPGDGTLTPVQGVHIKRKPPQTVISPRHPLIILQTSNRFADTTEDWNFDTASGQDPYEAARAHGREAARVWNEVLPDDIRPYCQLQMELRLRDHAERYKRLRCMLDETQRAGVQVSLQISDPHDTFTFDPIYVDKLLDEFSCIKSVGITESRTEHYHTFNVPRYAVYPDTLYAMDVIKIAARHGVHVSMSYQMLKWMHLTTDELNRPLLDTIQEYSEYILPQNEHLLAQHLPRQTVTWGTWLAGMVDNWGIEPQSWWYENGRMLSPGVFGKPDDDAEKYAEFDGRPLMPPQLYRAMILEGAKMGATVYQFEPFWDLFDYSSSVCWREAIYPTLMEVINDRLIPTRKQVMEKVKVAYHLQSATSIRDFHVNLRDVDWIADDGLLARAAYGVWTPYLEHELIPNRGRYYYIPLLPPTTPQRILDRFPRVLEPGACDSVAGYEAVLDQYYPTPDGEGTACIMSINGHTYVMQSHENLYERQTYAIDLPKPVRGITVTQKDKGLVVEWPRDAGATKYHLRVASCGADQVDPFKMKECDTTRGTRFVISHPEPGCTYSVTATTSTLERREGTVNYLDYLVFSQSESLPAELIQCVSDGAAQVTPVPVKPDTRPASQVVYPTFDGVSPEHRTMADAIVARIDALKDAYDAHDLDGMEDLYSPSYCDAERYTKQMAVLDWRRWFDQNNRFSLLRQIRQWDFSDYARAGEVRVTMFTCFTAIVIDRRGGWARYDQYARVPRTEHQEVTYTWKQDADGVWRIAYIDPPLMPYTREH